MATHDTLAALDALLDAEADALRRADFAALAALIPGKQALERDLATALTRAPATGTAVPDLRALAAKARRNELVLRAAIGGLRAARLRLSELRRAAQGTTTYDRSGHRNHHPAGPGQVTRRA